MGRIDATNERHLEYAFRFNLLETKTYADAEAVTYTYRADGKLSVRTWARPDGFNPLTTTYAYYDDVANNTGELEKIDYSDTTPDVTFDTYDRMGRLTQVTGAVGTRTFNFDDDLNPIKEIINSSRNPQLYYREITREYEVSASRAVSHVRTLLATTVLPPRAWAGFATHGGVTTMRPIRSRSCMGQSMAGYRTRGAYTRR